MRYSNHFRTGAMQKETINVSYWLSVPCVLLWSILLQKSPAAPLILAFFSRWEKEWPTHVSGLRYFSGKSSRASIQEDGGQFTLSSEGRGEVDPLKWQTQMLTVKRFQRWLLLLEA